MTNRSIFEKITRNIEMFSTACLPKFLSLRMSAKKVIINNNKKRKKERVQLHLTLIYYSHPR